MVKTDPASVNNVRLGLASAAHAADATVDGTGVSRDGFLNLMVIVNTKTMSNTTNTLVNIQSSDLVAGTYATMNDPTDATSESIFTLTPTDDDDIFWGVVRLQHQDAFVRAQVVAGATGTSDVGVNFVYFHAKDGRPDIDLLTADAASFRI